MIRFLVLFLCLVMNVPVFAAEYKVLRVVDGDTVYVDFNNNGFADKEERVRLNGIDAFETHAGSHLDWQMKTYGLTQKEVFTLGYMGMGFAREKLLGNYVEVEFTADDLTDKYGRPLVSINYNKNKSFEREMLKRGFATVYRLSNRAPELLKYEKLPKIKRNARKSDEYNLQFYNYKTGVYYTINSDEAQNPENKLINVKN